MTCALSLATRALAAPLPDARVATTFELTFDVALNVGVQLQIRERLQAHLPRAWIPDEIRRLPDLPMNANRKLDRSALAALVALA